MLEDMKCIVGRRKKVASDLKRHALLFFTEIKDTPGTYYHILHTGRLDTFLDSFQSHLKMDGGR